VHDPYYPWHNRTRSAVGAVPRLRAGAGRTAGRQGVSSPQALWHRQGSDRWREGFVSLSWQERVPRFRVYLLSRGCDQHAAGGPHAWVVFWHTRVFMTKALLLRGKLGLW